MASHNERERISTLFFYVVVLALTYLVFEMVQPFLAPLGWAAVIVIFCHPWQARLEARMGRTKAAALTTALVAIVLTVPGSFLMHAFVKEGLAAVGTMQEGVTPSQLAWLQKAWDSIRSMLSGWGMADLSTITADLGRKGAALLASQATGIAQNVALFVFDFFIMLFATFFLLRDSTEIMRAARRALPFEAGLRDRMIDQAADLVSASVTSGVIVASVQGLLGGLTFWALGIPAPVFWGVVMAFFCLLPLGAWVIWLPTALALMAGGHVAKGVILIVVGVAVVGMADNFLRPFLLSGKTRMGGLLIFIGLFGGIGVFGALGIILGPIVIATATGLMEAYAREEQ
jgi:predicted PurR-regulated permease PerM